MNDSKLFIYKFNDIFLDAIIELSLSKDVNRAIDFVTDAIPISRVVYHFFKA